VDSTGLVVGALRNVTRTIGTATAAEAIAMSAILAGFARYHGGGGDLNVSVLLFDARS
jgi:hypothetical protein